MIYCYIIYYQQISPTDQQLKIHYNTFYEMKKKKINKLFYQKSNKNAEISKQC